ncbi:MAG TPA: DUF2339 domain-containing protein, partial [Thermoanaerobaculia bacterium]|nr:DUF2339 domain-containing protein [Thermoanaerobaculia bacterium]
MMGEGCSAAVIGLLLLVVAALAVAALLRSRANAAAVARLGAELARLREQLERTGAGVREPGAGAREATPPAETAPEARPYVVTPVAAAAAPASGMEPLRPPPATAAAPASPVGFPPMSAGPPAAAVTAVAPAAAATSAPRRTTFEELVGARLLVWVGAMALALAGAFLVKISFERGWISPPIRVALGVAFGVGLLALGESLRRSSSRISEALSAAGIADLFACFLAAVHLYRLVPPAAGFLLMALTTAVAVALALRQGVMVALLGLTGGFLTPALIQTSQPSAR